MILLYSLIFIPQVYTHGFGKLEVISDLLPEDCFAQNLKYVEQDGLPRCGAFNDTEEGCVGYQQPDVVYKPTCSKNGQFGPKQCKGERATGRCFCFDANGERLFGQQWWSQADDMTCACSRKKADMAGSVYFNSLHCNSMGNYESLQCDVVSGQCWCADEKTGHLVSPVVPEQAKSKLPCYNSQHIGSSYLRQCENVKHAEDKITYQLSLRGTRASFVEFLCDDDGSYGVYTLVDHSAYCTWRDNSKIASFQSGNNYTGVNCNCARDTRIFSDAGKRQQLKCQGNGNYEEFQRSTTSAYCVDLDGFRKSTAGEDLENESNCTEYTAYH